MIKRGDLPISTERSILLNENTQSSYPHLAMWPLLRSWYFSYATIKLWVFYFEKVYITGLNRLVGVTAKKEFWLAILHMLQSPLNTLIKLIAILQPFIHDYS